MSPPPKHPDINTQHQFCHRMLWITCTGPWELSGEGVFPDAPLCLHRVSTCRHWRLPRPSPGGGYRPCPHMLALAPAGASICHRCHLASEATAVTRPQDNWLVDSLVVTKQVWGCAGSRRWGVLKDGLGNVVGVENGGRAGLRLGPGCRSVRCACLRRPALLQGSPEGPCSTPTTGAGGGVSPHAGAGAGACRANNERENRDPGTPSWVPHLMCQGSLGVAVGTG